MNRSFLDNDLKEWGFTLILSVMAGLFAYLLLHLLTELSILYFSYDLNIEAVLQVKGIHFISGKNDADWTKDATITVYLVKPILNMLMAIITMMVYTSIKNKSQSFSFFMIWIIIFGFNNVFGSFAENGLLKTGIYLVVEIMKLGTIVFWLLIGISIYFLYFFGKGTGKIILLSLPSKHKKSDKIKPLYFLIAYLIPWIIIFLITASFSDKNLIIIYLFGLVLLLPMLRSKGPDEHGLRSNPLLPFLWTDWISILFFVVGIYIMMDILSMNLQLH